MKKTIILFFSIYLYSTTIIGQGDSKKEALSDLSNQLSVNVKSEFKSYAKIIGSKTQQTKEREIYLSSNLPLKGVQYENNSPIKAILSSNAIKAYKTELYRLQKEINYLKKSKKNYDNLTKLLQSIDEFNKNKLVASALGATNLPNIDITKSQVEFELNKITKKVTSIDTASKIIASKLPIKKGIYISILPYSSKSATQLSNILQDSLSQYIQIEKYSDKAKYFLRGNYKILKNSIFLTLNLMDNTNKFLKTITIILDKKAYQNIQYKPLNNSFDYEISQGLVNNGKLHVKIGFKGNSSEDSLILKKGDIVDIVVKTNKPICYYIVGYILHNDQKLSYLLPINGEDYVNKITGDEVNTNYTVLEGLEVSAPFGRESLQIFAATLKNNKCTLSIPKCSLNNDGYCEIQGKPKNIIHKTRGLLLKTKKIEKAEDSINWTSFE